MGRLAHLARLALGRSAFEDLANDQEVNGANALDDENQQQYDAKGRPLNPRSLELDAELRHAQNEILAIVGVVEKKDKIIRDGEESHRLMRHTRHHILKAEDDIGDGISTVMLLYPILHMWVGGFIARLQIGLYPSHMSLSSILTHEWHALSQVGLVGGVLRLFPGLCALFRAIFLDIPILLATDQIVGRAQNYFIAGNLVRPAIERQIFTALPFLGVGVSLMFEFALWPITIYADAQRLGFAPVRPFASTFWPTSILPAYRLAWKPLVSAGKLGRLLTPAVLMILYHSCYKDGPTKASTPIGPQSPVFCLFTSYRNPPIDDGYKQVEKPTFISDPFGWTVHRNYLIRTSILKWLGW
ncbi:uncharacterized protein K489DRAFT_306454, partial [Dissoconium aciculare CBS 342.82]|uniref:Uncharacterized protein n=1 Tax=Dissoconium aciculare CBS 342.82 TaxID=1314786 RepID=A0A6J3M9R2_9PEZI